MNDSPAVAAPKMTPHTPAPPPLPPMQPIRHGGDDGPLGPEHTGQVVLARQQDLAEAEAQTEASARTAWEELRRREDDERHRRGLQRLLVAAGRYRDHRDLEDAERRAR